MLKKDEVFEVLKRDVKRETTWKGTLKMLKCDVRKNRGHVFPKKGTSEALKCDVKRETTCSQRKLLLER